MSDVMAATTMLQVSNEIPFGDCISSWLQMSQRYGLDSLVELSSYYERSYLAWEEVRKGRNPYFVNGTGFEGYFVGICSSPDEALDRILDVNQQMLANLLRLHRFDPRFRSRLLKTLTGESSDRQAMSEWSTEFGAALARLHCAVTQDRRVAHFHDETRGIVQWLPAITYSQVDHRIKQAYAVEDDSTPYGYRTIVNVTGLEPSKQDAWMVAQSIGKFGHPLVREFLRLNGC